MFLSALALFSLAVATTMAVDATNNNNELALDRLADLIVTVLGKRFPELGDVSGTDNARYNKSPNKTAADIREVGTDVSANKSINSKSNVELDEKPDERIADIRQMDGESKVHKSRTNPKHNSTLQNDDTISTKATEGGIETFQEDTKRDELIKLRDMISGGGNGRHLILKSTSSSKFGITTTHKTTSEYSAEQNRHKLSKSLLETKLDALIHKLTQDPIALKPKDKSETESKNTAPSSVPSGKINRTKRFHLLGKSFLSKPYGLVNDINSTSSSRTGQVVNDTMTSVEDTNESVKDLKHIMTTVASTSTLKDNLLMHNSPIHKVMKSRKDTDFNDLLKMMNDVVHRKQTIMKTAEHSMNDAASNGGSKVNEAESTIILPTFTDADRRIKSKVQTTSKASNNVISNDVAIKIVTRTSLVKDAGKLLKDNSKQVQSGSVFNGKLKRLADTMEVNTGTSSVLHTEQSMEPFSQTTPMMKTNDIIVTKKRLHFLNTRFTLPLLRRQRFIRNAHIMSKIVKQWKQKHQ